MGTRVGVRGTGRQAEECLRALVLVAEMPVGARAANDLSMYSLENYTELKAHHREYRLGDCVSPTKPRRRGRQERGWTEFGR